MSLCCFFLIFYGLPALQYQLDPYGEDGHTKTEGKTNTWVFLALQNKSLQEKRKFATSFSELDYVLLKGEKISQTENYTYHLMNLSSDRFSSSILAFPKQNGDPTYIARIHNSLEFHSSNLSQTILCVSTHKISMVEVTQKYHANELIFTNNNGMLECSKEFKNMQVN